MPDRRRLALLLGGRSTEHGVSCVSAGSVLRVLDRDAWDVVLLGVTRAGRWVLVDDDPDALVARDGVLPEVPEDRPGVVLPGDPTAAGLLPLERDGSPLAGVDVAFPLLHGPWGEDGTLQGLLEMAGVPYVGSAVLASAAAMDKPTMKVLLRGAGLATPADVLVDDLRWRTDRAAVLAEVEALGRPLFVKPARGGSSIGVSRVGDGDDLEAAVEAARVHDPRVVAERAVTGREVECGVLAGVDGGPPEASVPGEIVVEGEHAFYDFEAKYVDGSTGLHVPADLPRATAELVREQAVHAFRALGCEGLARVDFFVGEHGDVQVNEVNTMPGFTPSSMFPLLWRASGVDYAALVDRLLRDALARGTGLR